MYTNLSLHHADTRQCFQDFLGELMLTYGEGEVPDFPLKENDRPDKCDKNTLCVDLSRDWVDIRRPFPNMSNIHSHSIQRVALPHYYSEKPDQAVAGTLDAVSGLLQRLYPDHKEIQRHRNEQGNWFSKDPVSYRTVRVELRAWLSLLITRPKVQALRLTLTSHGMFSLYALAERNIPLTEHTRRFAFTE